MKWKQSSTISFFVLGFTSAILMILILLNLFFTSKENLTQSDQFPQGYRIVNPPLPEVLTFAGEPVPMENFEVFERIEREFIVNTYWHSATLLSLKRASRWFPIIEPILKQNGIPADFKFLAMIESNLENVISPAGATGFWQFMESSARKYGLEISATVDERYHVEKSTQAACEYLRDAYNMFGNWTVAAASYNMGTNGMANQITRQGTKSYYNLVLNAETSRFIARIISMKYIYSTPENYGFDLKEDQLYKPLDFYEISIDSSVSDLVSFAAYHGINYKILKLYNPWLRDNKLTAAYGKTYKIKIPVKGSIVPVEE
ncbi:MAG: lytic transglycosylase domain-containing protein [Ignavibacteriaceae bacterium]